MYVDYVLNGRASGQFEEMMGGSRWDAGMLRPYIDSQGRRCVTVNTGRVDDKGRDIREKRLISEMLGMGYYSPVFNATSLRKEEWIKMDEQVLKAARYELRAWQDLQSANSYRVNGMGTTILEHETMSDPGEAVVDMDGVSEGRGDSPKYQLEGMPLPITHMDFSLSRRRLESSRRGGNPLDTTLAEAAGRRVAEMIEKTLIGVETGITYGGTNTLSYGRNPTVFGYTNFTNRLTKTNLTTPTGSNPEATVNDVLAMRQQLLNNKFRGPYIIYHSTDWDTYLDNDYARLGGNNANQTLRQRLTAIEGITAVRRLDYLASATNPYTLLMVQMTQDVARAVNGMDITTVQWESKGGMVINFKVMCILVPQLRADYYGNCGILHATTS